MSGGSALLLVGGGNAENCYSDPIVRLPVAQRKERPFARGGCGFESRPGFGVGDVNAACALPSIEARGQ